MLSPPSRLFPPSSAGSSSPTYNLLTTFTPPLLRSSSPNIRSLSTPLFPPRPSSLEPATTPMPPSDSPPPPYTPTPPTSTNLSLPPTIPRYDKTILHLPARLFYTSFHSVPYLASIALPNGTAYRLAPEEDDDDLDETESKQRVSFVMDRSLVQEFLGELERRCRGDEGWGDAWEFLVVLVEEVGMGVTGELERAVGPQVMVVNEDGVFEDEEEGEEEEEDEEEEGGDEEVEEAVREQIGEEEEEEEEEKEDDEFSGDGLSDLGDDFEDDEEDRSTVMGNQEVDGYRGSCNTTIPRSESVEVYDLVDNPWIKDMRWTQYRWMGTIFVESFVAESILGEWGSPYRKDIWEAYGCTYGTLYPRQSPRASICFNNRLWTPITISAPTERLDQYHAPWRYIPPFYRLREAARYLLNAEGVSKVTLDGPYVKLFYEQSPTELPSRSYASSESSSESTSLYCSWPPYSSSSFSSVRSSSTQEPVCVVFFNSIAHYMYYFDKEDPPVRRKIAHTLHERFGCELEVPSYYDDTPKLINGDLYYSAEVRKCDRVRCPYDCGEKDGPGDWNMEDPEHLEWVKDGVVRCIGEIMDVGKVVRFYDVVVE